MLVKKDLKSDLNIDITINSSYDIGRIQEAY